MPQMTNNTYWKIKKNRKLWSLHHQEINALYELSLVCLEYPTDYVTLEKVTIIREYNPPYKGNKIHWENIPTDTADKFHWQEIPM